MADAGPLPAPPPKSGPLRWILLGCGVLTGIFVLGMGGCAGYFYCIYKGSDGVARVGEDYLRSAPELRNLLSSHSKISRHFFKFHVSVVNDGGHALISYTIYQGQAGLDEAQVWLLRKAGTWNAVGAKVWRDKGETLRAGDPPEGNRELDWY